MKIMCSGTYAYNPRILMQKCGYAEMRNANGTSYARVFGRGGYPRFHAYIDLVEGGFEIKLHLDQKKPTYGEGTAHSGEYDGEIVENEGARINMIIQKLRR